MKRLLTITLAIMLILSIAACNPKDKVQDALRDELSGNNSGNSGNSGNGGNSGNSGNSGNGNISDDELQDAMDQLEKWALAQGWDENRYGNWIYGKWDSEVLPSCVPKEIDGVKVDQTSYKEKRHDTYSGSYGIGDVSFSDGAYEEWGVSFYCTDAQLDEFIAAMEANGFYGGQIYDSEYAPEWAWLGNGYYAHMHVNPQSMGEDGYDNFASFSITQDNHNPYPVAFMGTKLPKIGVVMYDYTEGAGMGWDGEDYELVEPIWDVFADKGQLYDNGWNLWLDYFGVKPEQAAACVQDLVAQGWTLTYEDTTYDGEGFVYHLEKGDMVAGVEQSAYTMSIRFADISENIWY